jgi:hypothetical protein
MNIEKISSLKNRIIKIIETGKKRVIKSIDNTIIVWERFNE